MTDGPAYLRAAGIAQHLGVSERTVRRWIASRELPSVKIGGARLVAKEDLERLLAPNKPAIEETADGMSERQLNQVDSDASGKLHSSTHSIY